MIGEIVQGIIVKPDLRQQPVKGGVVCLPGTNGGALMLTNTRFYRKSKTGSLIGWAKELARRGFPTLSLSVWGCLERKRTQGFDPQLQTKFLAPYGLTGMGLGVYETIAGCRVLADFLSTDANKIGVAGYSLGGNISWYAMACCEHIATAVSVCGGLGSMQEVIKQATQPAKDPKRHGPYFYIPHLLRFFDHPTIVKTCIFPRPLMLIGPLDDEDMPKNGVDQLEAEVMPRYVRASVPNRFKICRPSGNHTFSFASFESVVEWFSKYL